MPPSLALVLTTGFVIYLFRQELRYPEGRSRALWIPILWMVITGSRFVSQWLDVLGLMDFDASNATTDSSPVDAIIFLILIIAGLRVLQKRRITLAIFVRNNSWMAAFFVYCLLAILWSDFPSIAARRWIKVLGHPVMALVILTEPDPALAIRSVFKRVGFLLVTYSVMLIKYFPSIGRAFESTGTAVNCGVTANKNELGNICMISGIFFVWNLLFLRGMRKSWERRYEVIVSIGMLIMIGWLLHMVRSSTSLGCLLLGIAVLVVAGTPILNKRYIGTFVLGALVLCALGEFMFGIYAKGIEMLGRDPTLTDRTKLWGDLMRFNMNPIFGAGFESFWLGDRLKALWNKWWWHPTEAHNGYLEVYLNLGIVGLSVLGGLFLSTFFKIKRNLLGDFELGRFCLAFFFVILTYNYTEATFKGVSIVWLVFHIIAVDVPKRKRSWAIEAERAWQPNIPGEAFSS